MFAVLRVTSRTQQSEQYTHHTYDMLPHMVCVLFAVFSATCRTEHSEQYTYHTYDMLPHHRITYNDVVFTES